MLLGDPANHKRGIKGVMVAAAFSRWALETFGYKVGKRLVNLWVGSTAQKQMPNGYNTIVIEDPTIAAYYATRATDRPHLSGLQISAVPDRNSEKQGWTTDDCPEEEFLQTHPHMLRLQTMHSAPSFDNTCMLLHMVCEMQVRQVWTHVIDRVGCDDLVEVRADAVEVHVRCECKGNCKGNSSKKHKVSRKHSKDCGKRPQKDVAHSKAQTTSSTSLPRCGQCAVMADARTSDALRADGGTHPSVLVGTFGTEKTKYTRNAFEDVDKGFTAWRHKNDIKGWTEFRVKDVETQLVLVHRSDTDGGGVVVRWHRSQEDVEDTAFPDSASAQAAILLFSREDWQLRMRCERFVRYATKPYPCTELPFVEPDAASNEGEYTAKLEELAERVLDPWDGEFGGLQDRWHRGSGQDVVGDAAPSPQGEGARHESPASHASTRLQVCPEWQSRRLSCRHDRQRVG